MKISALLILITGFVKKNFGHKAFSPPTPQMKFETDFIKKSTGVDFCKFAS